MVSKSWLRLKKLIHSLSFRERNYISKVIRASSSHLSRESQLLKLFETFEDVSHPIAQPVSRNRKQEELLEDKILDILLMDVNLRREVDYYSDHLKLHKKYLKSQLLRQRAVMDRSFTLAGTCAAEALKLENYTLAIQCLRLQLAMVSLHRCEEDFRKLIDQIDHYEYCNAHKNRAIRLYSELKMKKYLKIFENLDLFISSSLQKLVGFQRKMESQTVNFIRLYFEKELSEVMAQPQKALEQITRLYEICQVFVDCQKVLNHHELMAEKGRLSFEIGNIATARYFLNKSLVCLPLESDSYQEALELLFLIEYLEGNYKVSDQLLKSFTSSRVYKEVIPVQHKQRWLQYQVYQQFSQGNMSKCIKKLDEIFHIGKPGVELNLNIRLMKAVCLIERENLDLADREIDAMRKFISRNKLNSVLVSMGLKDFFEMLWQLRYCGYEFSRLPERGIDVHHIIHSRKTFLKHRPLTHHLLRYTHWLKGKVALEQEVGQASSFEELHVYRRDKLLRHQKIQRLYY